MLKEFESGELKKSIDQQAKHLVESYKSGKRILIGVNKFPNAKDAPTPSSSSGFKASKGIKALSLTNELLSDQTVSA